MNTEFDYNFYANRNRQIAYEKYGNLIDKNRHVIGTLIWFDKYWRYHYGQI